MLLLVVGLVSVLLDDDSALNRVVSAMEPWVIVSAGLTYVALEGVEGIVLAARYREALREAGRREGEAEGIAEGEAKGRRDGEAKGREEQQRRWEAWEIESRQAREEGREPPPTPTLD